MSRPGGLLRSCFHTLWQSVFMIWDQDFPFNRCLRHHVRAEKAFRRTTWTEQPRPGDCRKAMRTFLICGRPAIRLNESTFKQNQYLVLTNLYNRKRTTGTRLLPAHNSPHFVTWRCGKLWSTWRNVSTTQPKQYNRTTITLTPHVLSSKQEWLS
jgi:hypothetical protein